MLDLGKVRPGSTLRIPFSSFDKDDGSSITMTNYAVADILIYKDGSTTERASTAGFTATTDFDAKTGKHVCIIDLADNTTAGFFAAGSEYLVAIDAVTVDGVTTGGWLARFLIGYDGSLYDTTIATLSSQTSFTLTTGPAEDDALNDQWCIIHDVASAVQWGKAIISDYTGSTKTVTLAAGTTFTAAATDNISIMGPMPMQPTVAARKLDVSTGGEAGLDWANVGSPTTTVGLSGTTVKTATDVETDTADIQSRIPAALVGGRIDSNVGAISSDATAADNAEAFFDGTGYAGTGNTIPTVTTVTNGVTLANGAHGGTSAVITAERIVVASTTAGEPALKLTGNTSGAGLLATGGSSGAGVKAVGGSSSGAGVQVIGTAGNAHAASFTGQGSGDGLYIKGGATGNGIEAEAGSSGGDGIITSALGGNRHGLRAVAAGTGNGIYATGGSSAGSGIMAASSGGGVGISASGDGSSAGIVATGGATGHGIAAVGGATSGNGINVTTTSGHGINLAPAGTNMHGILSTGGNGGTSDGVSFVAGTGGVGLRAGSLTVTGATTLSGAVSFGSTWGVTGAITFSSTWTGNLTGTVATVTTLTGHTPQTGDSFARIGATGSGLTSLAPSTVLTTALTESYRSDGSTGTATQLLYEILQNLTEFSIASTTKTVKKIDGSTTAAAYTLDSATAPTSITRTS